MVGHMAGSHGTGVRFPLSPLMTEFDISAYFPRNVHIFAVTEGVNGKSYRALPPSDIASEDQNRLLNAATNLNSGNSKGNQTYRDSLIVREEFVDIVLVPEGNLLLDKIRQQR